MHSLPQVLLVDDEPRVTEALKRALRHEPYEVLMAASASEALRVLEAKSIDVIVSDEKMPGLSGSRFLAAVRLRFPGTIRIMLSGEANLDTALRAINEGEVHRFFVKPCNPAVLAVTIREALVQRRLEIQSRRLLRAFQHQAGILARLDGHGSDLLDVELDNQGSVFVDPADADCSVEELLTEMERTLIPRTPIG
jgi:DNA-binding NtrC family response regulator